MAALVVPGAPVSVLIDHGLTEAMVEKLMEGGVSTVESLGSMTPEELEVLPGIDPEMVEAIHDEPSTAITASLKTRLKRRWRRLAPANPNAAEVEATRPRSEPCAGRNPVKRQRRLRLRWSRKMNLLR